MIANLSTQCVGSATMRPWIYLPAKLAHDLAPLGLEIAAAFRERKTFAWAPRQWRGMKFANPLGIAGGVDKTGDHVEDWWTFGPGFVEVGTVTPEPQSANPGKILSRDLSRMAVWNKMGFPNQGMYAMREALHDIPGVRHTPIFVNIGKNRNTPLSQANEDYAKCIRVLAGFADAFVVNISSPNTAGLRELLAPENLKVFLGGCLAARNKAGAHETPMLLKLSPDLNENDLASVVQISLQLGIDGFVATNSTASREPMSTFPREGGVSGAPLAERAKQVLLDLNQRLGTGESRRNRLLISVGGVMTAEDVHERLSLGADLVQVYSALVFHGPGFFAQVARASHNLKPQTI